MKKMRGRREEGQKEEDREGRKEEDREGGRREGQGERVMERVMEETTRRRRDWKERREVVSEEHLWMMSGAVMSARM